MARSKFPALIAVIGLIASFACNLPTPTRIPLCTPPACRTDEVLYCPDGVCPGDCDTECATPTPSPTVTATLMSMCTPPACEENEVYHCPDECPGGCGTECATPTPSPMPVCTPPACDEGEVFYCPDECPGGCGTECATPTSEPITPTDTPEPSPTFTDTPEPTDTPTIAPTDTVEPTATHTATATPEVLQIVTFLGSKTSLDEGDELQVSWDVRHADSAYIEWTNQYRIIVKEEPLTLPEGLLTLYPYRGEVTLTASRGLEQVSQTLTLNIGCPIPWPNALDSLYTHYCPSSYNTSWAAYQEFQHGYMIWVESEDLIYVFYDATQYNTYYWHVDTFETGDPDSDPTIIPPTGLYQPIRGFGKLWRDYPAIRNGLGWATAEEQGYDLHWYTYALTTPSSMYDWFSTPTAAFWRMHPYTHTWSQVAP